MACLVIYQYLDLLGLLDRNQATSLRYSLRKMVDDLSPFIAVRKCQKIPAAAAVLTNSSNVLYTRAYMMMGVHKINSHQVFPGSGSNRPPFIINQYRRISINMDKKKDTNIMNINQDFCIFMDQRLGKGKYGQVYKGFQKSKSKVVAVKELLSGVQNIWETDAKLRREVDIMRVLIHDNILKLIDVIVTKEKVYIILEYCDGGELRQFMNKNKGQDGKITPMSEIQAFRFFRQLVKGMAYVNSKDCFHRDLKPENIMLTSENVIKIGDFGFARTIIGTSVDQLQKYTNVGTPLYAAPNVCTGDLFSGKCDVWSLGCITFQMLTGKNIFGTINSLKLLRMTHAKMEEEPFVLKEKGFHPFFYEFLPKMMAFNQLDRISFEELQAYLKLNEERIEVEMQGLNFSNKPVAKNEKPLESVIIENKTSLKNKITVKNNPYKTNSEAILPEDIQKQESEYTSTVQYFKYNEFLYQRAALFTELAKKLNQNTNYPVDSPIRYLMMYTCIGIFLNTIERLLKHFTSSYVRLPNGREILFDKIDEKYKPTYKRHVDEYSRKLLEEKNKYLSTVIAIKAKLTSSKYQTDYAKILKRYEILMAQLAKTDQKSKIQPIDFFETNFRNIRKECYSEKQKSPDFIRIYYMSVYLGRYQQLLPEEQFKDEDRINKAKSSFEKLSLEEIHLKLKQLEKQ